MAGQGKTKGTGINESRHQVSQQNERLCNFYLDDKSADGEV